MQKGTTNPKRDIPATRVAAFIRQYIDENIEVNPERGDWGLAQFCFEAGVGERWLYRVLHGETANVSFDRVDEMLVNLDRIHLWHLGPEDGGFADYYCDEPAAAAGPSVALQRSNAVLAAKRKAREDGRNWLEVLMDRARAEMELACA